MSAERSRPGRRAVVKGEMRASLNRGEDPRELYGVWHDNHGYCKRQLRNMLMQVKERALEEEPHEQYQIIPEKPHEEIT